jgi:hypothetical protein
MIFQNIQHLSQIMLQCLIYVTLHVLLCKSGNFKIYVEKNMSAIIVTGFFSYL